MSKQDYTATPAADLSVDLTNFHGVVIHQRAQVGEAIAQAFGIPFEARNKYVVSPLPESATVVQSNKSPNLWKPSFEEITGLPELFMMKEKSDCFTRVLFTCCIGRSLRPLDVLLLENGLETTTRMNKPCKCGAWICCPLEMSLSNGGNRVGQVRENFDPYCSKCFDCCCCCSVYHNIYVDSTANAPIANTMDRGGDEPRYELKFHMCCCQGQSNNWCGATCFNHNAIFEIRDPKTGQIVGSIQKLFAPSTSMGAQACCRMCHGFDTFAVGFPEGSSHEDRMMLIAGILQAEFQLFEQDQQ